MHSDAQEEAAEPAVWEQLADLVAHHRVTIPIEKVYPLADLVRAFRDVADRHGRGERILAIGAALR